MSAEPPPARGQQPGRDLSGLVVAPLGRLEDTGQAWEPYRVTGPDGQVVEGVREFLADLQAAGRSEATLRSYAMDLLRWCRFCWAFGIVWQEATRPVARDFCRWMQLAGKSSRPRPGDGGKGAPEISSQPYAPSVRAHAETVLRGFYDFHREAGSGPAMNPFPFGRSPRERRPNAHHNPMEPYTGQNIGLYRPKLPKRLPRYVPDAEFNKIFACLPSDRDRALVAFYVSSGARASELLSATQGGTDPGRQLVTVVRKGSHRLQELPASVDAFVWLRLYQLEMEELVPRGPDLPLWWTLRRPVRPLGYAAAHRMFERANGRAGTGATLHSLRHTAAYRMAEDPSLPLTDVQEVLGHVNLSTTQIYLVPRKEDVVRRMLAHYAGQARRAAQPAPLPAAAGYRPEVLEALFTSQPGKSGA